MPIPLTNRKKGKHPYPIVSWPMSFVNLIHLVLWSLMKLFVFTTSRSLFINCCNTRWICNGIVKIFQFLLKAEPISYKYLLPKFQVICNTKHLRKTQESRSAMAVYLDFLISIKNLTINLSKHLMINFQSKFEEISTIA